MACGTTSTAVCCESCISYAIASDSIGTSRGKSEDKQGDRCSKQVVGRTSKLMCCEMVIRCCARIRYAGRRDVGLKSNEIHFSCATQSGLGCAHHRGTAAEMQADESPHFYNLSKTKRSCLDPSAAAGRLQWCHRLKNLAKVKIGGWGDLQIINRSIIIVNRQASSAEYLTSFTRAVHLKIQQFRSALMCVCFAARLQALADKEMLVG